MTSHCRSTLISMPTTPSANSRRSTCVAGGFLFVVAQQQPVRSLSVTPRQVRFAPFAASAGAYARRPPATRPLLKICRTAPGRTATMPIGRARRLSSIRVM